ncbi:hypothetical protein HHI36_004621 [Cryptolaemus montrouzieri]|uniref:Cytochrome P450 n=1 Tax=Cryptolaemus montrouzieri TaxID=559131 RepID=A0ABD2NSI2_9CUCU
MMIIISFVLILICSLFTLFLRYMARNNTYWKQQGINYIKPKPIFGNIFDIVLCRISIGGLIRKFYEEHSEHYIGFFMFDQPCLLVNDLELIKQILVEDFKYFQGRTFARNHKDDPIGSKLLFFAGLPWRKMRKDMSAVFTPSKLKQQANLLPGENTKLIDALKQTLSEGKNVLNVKDFTDKHTVNTISSAYFSIEGNSFKNQNSPMLEIFGRILHYKALWNIYQLTYMIICPKLYKLLGMRFVDAFSTSFLRKLTWDLLDEREKSNFENNDCIDVLLNLKRKEDIKECTSIGADFLAGHVCQVFVAGYETSSTTISYALFELAKNPKHQNLARHEATTVMKTYGKFTYENVMAMKHITNCLLGKRFGMYSSIVTLAYLLLHFEMRLPEGYPTNIEFSNRGFLLEPNEGVYLKFSELK